MKEVNKVKLNSFTSHHLDSQLNHHFDVLNIFLTFHVSYIFYVYYVSSYDVFYVSFVILPLTFPLLLKFSYL